ncbi:MAG TPA: type III-B CRISPR-associated protein Cas10/Cmr2 [Ktedonobacteraceae bacterium]|nr:type III-B CRISPR-associated protein Cas10/Cmr2 [Ktedonobacteraceae bacterium]
MNYLLLVQIGPVQDFIASARRTRDLAFGSWFLSELSRAAAREIVAQNGLSSLIFPAPAREEMLQPNNGDFVVPNKIIAVVQQSPQTLGEQIQQAIMERLHAICDQAYRAIHFAGDMRSIADAQVEELVEFFWVALSFQDEAYQHTRAQLEAMMAARKSTRNFSQVSWGDAVPKSSINGQLESVIPEREYPSPGASEEAKRNILRRLYNNYGAGPAERLSGVDLLKRRGVTASGEHFPSTSHMATIPFLQRLEILKNGHLRRVQDAWESYIEIVKEKAFSPQLERVPDWYPDHPLLGRYEGSMLLEGRLVDVLYAPGEDMSRRSAPIQMAKLALQHFYAVLDAQFDVLRLPRMRPDLYYAFLQADGDGMGEIIDAQAAHGETRHRQLSQTLSDFAGKARTIVREHQGAMIYAGGDDVQALLPLHTVLECASQLASAFRDTLQEFEDQAGRKPSLSVGIAIAHHLDSLQRVRRLAKNAEDQAKGIEGKKALCVTLSKRSGETYTIAGHWDNLDRSMQRLVDFALRGAIPHGTPYELRDLVLRLGLSAEEPAQSQPDYPYAAVIELDALRILKRKLAVPKGKFPPDQVEEIERFFKARLGIEQEPHPEIGRVQPVFIGELIHELIVAQVLASAKQMAQSERERSRVWLHR